MADGREVGRQLARQHQSSARPPSDTEKQSSLVHYAESSRSGDWSLRSALVRLAQPEPERAGAILELVRRCDGSIAGFVRQLETVMVDPTVERGSGRDIRTADLARLMLQDAALFLDVLDGYQEASPLEEAEVAALPYLAVAATLDELAVVLTEWAAAGASDAPPYSRIDELGAIAFERLESLGVPREQGGPPGRRGRS